MGDLRTALGSPAVVKAFVRADELQYVFIVRKGDSYALAETCELWEQPAFDSSESCYLYYPTVLAGQEHGSFDRAEREVLDRLPWTAGDAGDSAS